MVTLSTEAYGALANVGLFLLAVIPITAVALYSIRRWRNGEWESLAKSRGEALKDARSDLAQERTERLEEATKLREENTQLRERVASLEAQVESLRERTDVTPLLSALAELTGEMKTLLPMVVQIQQAVVK